MTILEYFSLDEARQARWRAEIGRADWRAARFLRDKLKSNRLKALCGASTRVLLGVEGEALAAFCVLAEKDDVRETGLTPWIGFVYTAPACRGQRRSQAMIEHACALARADGHAWVYLSTNEIGLYEKYGFEFMAMMKDAWGEDTRVYRRRL